MFFGNIFYMLYLLVPLRKLQMNTKVCLNSKIFLTCLPQLYTNKRALSWLQVKFPGISYSDIISNVVSFLRENYATLKNDFSYDSVTAVEMTNCFDSKFTLMPIQICFISIALLRTVWYKPAAYILVHHFK